MDLYYGNYKRIFMDRDLIRTINSFAPWASAIGTFCAVVVSLYFSRRDRKEYIKFYSNIKSVLSTNGSDNNRYLHIHITNNGIRPIIIQAFGWVFGSKNKPIAYQFPPENNYSDKTPKQLNESESFNMFIDLKGFEKGFLNAVNKLETNRNNLKLKKLKFSIYTTRNTFVRKVDKEIYDFLNKISGGKEV
jgi:hypothetical protein